MAKFCHKCGTQAIDDESVFCTKCGTQYIQNIPEKKDDVCPKCGTKILDKQSVFCNKCGSQVSAISPVTDQQVDEQPVVAQPIIKRKRCPACGVPFVNENKYYCDSCGAYLRGSSPINLPQSKKVVTSYNRSIQPNIQQNTRPKKSRANLGLVFVGVGVLLFIVLIAAVFSLQSPSTSSSLSQNRDTDFSQALLDSLNKMAPITEEIRTDTSSKDFTSLKSDAVKLIAQATKDRNKLSAIPVSSKWQGTKTNYLLSLDAFADAGNSISKGADAYKNNDIETATSAFNTASIYIEHANNYLEKATSFMP